MNTEEFDRQGKEARQNNKFSDREYNEESRRLNNLVSEGEWESLKGNAAYMRLSVERRITKAIDAVSARMHQNEIIFGQVVAEYPDKAGTILEKKVKPLRRLKKALGVCLAGDFDQVKDDVREKVNNVLGINSPNKPNKPSLKPA